MNSDPLRKQLSPPLTLPTLLSLPTTQPPVKILLAMSGGVDSSVVAHVLAAQGHELIGVRFTLWSDPLAPAMAQILPSKCCNAQTAARCAQVAKDLKMPLHILDLEDEFKRTVVDPFLADYRKGLSPNPCIGCNRTIKFGKLIELADSLGCEKLATGHYARVATERLPDGSERTLLLEAVDSGKDQSYYLYGLDQPTLQRVMFPLGTMQKADVLTLARRYGVPLPEHYQESQDLCFFPERTPRAFLLRHLGSDVQRGDIVRRDGSVVGTHEGLPLYTVGQRRGLKIGGLRIPLEVVGKDGTRNRLIVSDKGTERISSIPLKDVRFVDTPPPMGQSLQYDCRLRSLAKRTRGRLFLSQNSAAFHFDDPQPPQAAGQSLVLYRGDEVVGGGVMC